MGFSRARSVLLGHDLQTSLSALLAHGAAFYLSGANVVEALDDSHPARPPLIASFARRTLWCARFVSGDAGISNVVGRKNTSLSTAVLNLDYGSTELRKPLLPMRLRVSNMTARFFCATATIQTRSPPFFGAPPQGRRVAVFAFPFGVDCGR